MCGTEAIQDAGDEGEGTPRNSCCVIHRRKRDAFWAEIRQTHRVGQKQGSPFLKYIYLGKKTFIPRFDSLVQVIHFEINIRPSHSILYANAGFNVSIMGERDASVVATVVSWLYSFVQIVPSSCSQS